MIDKTSLVNCIFYYGKLLRFAVDLGLDTIRQHKHRVCMPKIHASYDGKIIHACFFCNHLQECFIVFFMLFNRDLAARSAKEYPGQPLQDSKSRKSAQPVFDCLWRRCFLGCLQE